MSDWLIDKSQQDACEQQSSGVNSINLRRDSALCIYLHAWERVSPIKRSRRRSRVGRSRYSHYFGPLFFPAACRHANPFNRSSQRLRRCCVVICRCANVYISGTRQRAVSRSKFIRNESLRPLLCAGLLLFTRPVESKMSCRLRSKSCWVKVYANFQDSLKS